MVDVFTQLTQCFDVVSKLECPDPEIWKRYMRRFAKTIVKVLIAYADIVKKEFPEHMKDERIVSTKQKIKMNMIKMHLKKRIFYYPNFQQIEIRLLNNLYLIKIWRFIVHELCILYNK